MLYVERYYEIIMQIKEEGNHLIPSTSERSQLPRHMMEKQGYDGETYNNTKSFEHLTL